MIEYKNTQIVKMALLLAFAIPLSACFHDDDDDMMPSMATYEVTVFNATNNQPLTPVAVIAHQQNFNAWQTGSAATTGLEMLAESGDPSQLLADADMDTNVTATAASSSGPFGPGSAQTVMIETMADSNLQLSIATMLANTNDAFTGVTHVTVGDMAMGESLSMMAKVYDAGTEANSESAATIPGPAGNGEGFNATRDDTDFVSIHAGVITFDDGLMTSALNEDHRWLGPAAKISITRVQ